LHEIVGSNDIPRQRTSIAAQPRDFGFEHPGEFVHRFPSSLLRLPAVRFDN
jgi:hypothetical protein